MLKYGILILIAGIFFISCGGKKKNPIPPGPYELPQYPGVERSEEIEGIRIVYLDEGQGEPILFIHGLTGDITDWEANIPHFKQNYRVLALDLPGHGKSEKRNDIPYNKELYTMVVRQFLINRGVDSAVVVGNSMGGMIAANLALNHPDMVKKLVLVDAAGVTPMKGLARFAINRITPRMTRKYWANPKMITKSSGAAYAHPENYPKGRIKEDIAIVQQPDAAEYAYAVTLSLKDTMKVDFREDLDKITCPTLIIWGEADRVVGPKAADNWRDGIAGSKLVIIPDAGHLPMLETPEVFNKTLDEFIQQ